MAQSGIGITDQGFGIGGFAYAAFLQRVLDEVRLRRESLEAHGVRRRR